METTENESTPTIVYCKGPDTRRSKWRFPTAISKLQHRETPLGAILTDLNFFDSPGLDDVKRAYRRFAPTYTQSVIQQADLLLSSLTIPPESLDDKRI
jgi:hypothetical protein